MDFRHGDLVILSPLRWGRQSVEFLSGLAPYHGKPGRVMGGPCGDDYGHMYYLVDFGSNTYSVYEWALAPGGRRPSSSPARFRAGDYVTTRGGQVTRVVEVAPVDGYRTYRLENGEVAYDHEVWGPPDPKPRIALGVGDVIKVENRPGEFTVVSADHQCAIVGVVQAGRVEEVHRESVLELVHRNPIRPRAPSRVLPGTRDIGGRVLEVTGVTWSGSSCQCRLHIDGGSVIVPASRLMPAPFAPGTTVTHLTGHLGDGDVVADDDGEMVMVAFESGVHALSRYDLELLPLDTVPQYVTQTLTDKDFRRSNKKEFRTNPLERFLSVEVEVAGLKGPARGGRRITTLATRTKHGVVSDGSLPRGGFEVNTCPANGDVFLGDVTKLCDTLADYGAFVTRDCGLHVHVDARDLGYWDIRRVVRLYAKVEPALFAACAPSRRNRCRYAQRCGMKYLFDIDRMPKSRHAISHAMYALNDHSREEHRRSPGAPDRQIARAVSRTPYGSPANAKSGVLKAQKQNKYSNNRYDALNLHSWVLRGTIEFRHHQGSVNTRKISMWAMLCGGVVDYAYRRSETELVDLCLDTSLTPLDVLRRACPTKAVADWLDERVARFGTAEMAQDEEVAAGETGRY